MPVDKNDPRSFEHALECRILHGLSLEWELALWNVAAHIRSQLKKPLFSLDDRRRRLGSWSPEKKVISLNRQFVREYPWAAVRNVLHHEMAHQIADEVFDGGSETAHGQSFQRACRYLRIDARASASYTTLDDMAATGGNAPEDRTVVRIRKLLALAKSQNPHEAEAAMLKAHELLAKYHVDLLLLETKRDYVSRLISKPALRHTREKYLLASLLQDYYFVQGIWVSAFVLDRGKMGRALEVSGSEQDVDMAAYVYSFVLNFIDRQWAAYRRGASRPLRKIDFSVGIVAGFKEKLDAQKERLKKVASTYALIEREDPCLTQYMATKYPRTYQVNHKSFLQDPAVLSDGMDIGRKLIISKGITETTAAGRLLPMRRRKHPA